jgi:hypothetical protein
MKCKAAEIRGRKNANADAHARRRARAMAMKMAIVMPRAGRGMTDGVACC